MWGRAARFTRWVDTTFTSYTSASCWTVKASAGPSTMCPALWTTTLMRPVSVMTRWMAASTISWLVTSIAMGISATPWSRA